MTSRANSSRRPAWSTLSLHGRAADTTAKMRQLVRPLPRSFTRPVSALILVVWAGVMGLLINRSYRHASATLATDLARYTSTAVWHGVYYRGEKIGFTVGQIVKKEDGFELAEDGRL